MGQYSCDLTHDHDFVISLWNFGWSRWPQIPLGLSHQHKMILHKLTLLTCKKTYGIFFSDLLLHTSDQLTVGWLEISNDSKIVLTVERSALGVGVDL